MQWAGDSLELARACEHFPRLGAREYRTILKQATPSDHSTCTAGELANIKLCANDCGTM
jgi:hypothetical protein